MRKKILIVEDNTELLELVRSTLRQAGFATMVATNGLDALKKARSGCPDLILLDLVLPELDGFAVCEHLRKDAVLAATPIIMMTGLTSSMTRYAGMESGANEYVTKPVTLEHLLSRVEHWLQTQPPGKAPKGTQENSSAETIAAAD